MRWQSPRRVDRRHRGRLPPGRGPYRRQVKCLNPPNLFMGILGAAKTRYRPSPGQITVKLRLRDSSVATSIHRVERSISCALHQRSPLSTCCAGTVGSRNTICTALQSARASNFQTRQRCVPRLRLGANDSRQTLPSTARLPRSGVIQPGITFVVKHLPKCPRPTLASG